MTSGSKNVITSCIQQLNLVTPVDVLIAHSLTSEKSYTPAATIDRNLRNFSIISDFNGTQKKDEYFFTPSMSDQVTCIESALHGSVGLITQIWNGVSELL